MSDSGEKTEEPTDKKLEDARKEGQVPQRKNVIEAGFLTSSVITLISISGMLTTYLVDVFNAALDGISGDFLFARKAVVTEVRDAGFFVLAFFGGSAAFTLLFGLFLNKFNFAPKAMSIKFSKLNPVSGVKNMFSKSTLYNFFRTLIYFILVSLILYFLIYSTLPDAVNAAHCGPRCLAPLFYSKMLLMIGLILAVLMLLALVDFKIQNMLHIKQNKMTKEDVKKEHKGMEGDPQVKGARKQIAIEDAHMPTIKESTHAVYSGDLFVALIFYQGQGQRPFVVMRSKGKSVTRLVQMCRQAGVPTFNLPSVAADFHKMGRVGQYMPAKCAKGMDQILAEADRLYQPS